MKQNTPLSLLKDLEQPVKFLESRPVYSLSFFSVRKKTFSTIKSFAVKILFGFSLLSLFTLPTIGRELEITSNSFRFEPTKNVSIFTGNVRAFEGKDYIYCNRLTIYLNKNRKPVKYVAVGKVKFRITLDKKDVYTGSGTRLSYFIGTGEILLEGNGTIYNQKTGNRLTGEFIKINRFSKKAEVKGSGKKPVKMVIQVQ